MYVIRAKFILMVCIIAAVIGVGIGGGVAVNVFRTSGGSNIPLYSVEREDNKISVTFNCAWGNEDIDAVLDTLSAYDVKSTFFLTGEWAEKYPESVMKIKDAGHEIGSHSYDHKDYTKLSESQIKEDVLRCDNIITGITGDEVKLVRTPSGAYNDTVTEAIESMGKTVVQWSRDSMDYGDATAEEIYRRSVEKTGEGDILLMHTGTKNTAAVLSRVLDSLTSRFELTTVSRLFVDGEFYIDNTGRMFPVDK